MRIRVMLLVVGLAVGMITAVLSVSVSAVSGADIMVNSPNDQLISGNGQCTLREAINNANSNSDTTAGDCAAGNGPDTIHLPSNIFLLLLTGPDEDANATGDLDILDDVIIEGAGWGLTLIDGQDEDRVFHIVTPGIQVEINDLTISGGYVPGAIIKYPTILGHGGAGILNEGGQLSLNSSVVSGNTIDNSGSGDGSGAGILNVDGSLTLSDTTVTLNTIIESYLLSMGAGVGSYGETTYTELTLINSTISENKANSSNAKGGGIGVFGRSNTTAAMVINNSLISANEADYAGGIFVSGTSGAYVDVTIDDSLVELNTSKSVGGMALSGSLPTLTEATIRNSTFNGNASLDLTAVALGSLGGGLYADNSTLLIANSTFSNNIIQDNDPDYGVGRGGGAFILDSTAVIANSTFSGNEAHGVDQAFSGQGGGLAVVAIAWPTSVTLLNSTIVSNTAYSSGGGLIVDGRYTTMVPATIYLQNTIIANNLVTTAPDTNCQTIWEKAYIVSNGNNLENLNTCGLYALTDLINTDPLIGPLQDNGGPTLTHALLDFSPAIDGADYDACTTSPVSGLDQRGVPRPIGPRCDIGAYESAAQSTYKFAFLPVTLK